MFARSRLLAAALTTALGLTAAAVAVPAGSAAAAGGWTPRPATYGEVVDKDVRITMSDGTVLDADVIRPNAAGRFPVLLTQTPYNKNTPSLNFRDDYLVTRGYVQVIVDVRGTGSSGGTWDSFGAREQRDGYELVEWAASHDRPWSNGAVGLHGTSYGAINQLFTAAQQPAGLKAAFPIVPAGDTYRDVAVTGGQMDTGFIPLWLGLVTAGGMAPPLYMTSDPVAAMTTALQHMGGAVSFQVPLLLDAATGGDKAFDGPWYRQRSPLEVIDKVRVPTFVVGGWYDLFQRSEPRIYQALRHNGVPTRLLMGPWYHLTASQGAGLPAQGVPTLDELELRWMDHYLRGLPDPTLDRDIAPVTYNQLGTGKWLTASDWFNPSMHAQAFHLSGSATPVAPGTLTAGAPAAGGPDQLPVVPVTGACSRSTTQWTAGAAAGGPVCENNQQVDDHGGLSFDLPVTQPMQLLGPVGADLFVSTTAHDGQLTARLEDVAPDGTVSQLTAGWQVLSLRALDDSRTVRRDGLVIAPYHPDTRASQQPVTPGQVMEVQVEIFPTGALVAPGHRLRLTIQGADFPHLTGTAPQELASTPAVLSLYHDPAHPSEVVLPVVG